MVPSRGYAYHQRYARTLLTVRAFRFRNSSRSKEYECIFWGKNFGNIFYTYFFMFSIAINVGLIQVQGILLLNWDVRCKAVHRVGERQACGYATQKSWKLLLQTVIPSLLLHLLLLYCCCYVMNTLWSILTGAHVTLPPMAVSLSWGSPKPMAAADKLYPQLPQRYRPSAKEATKYSFFAGFSVQKVRNLPRTLF